MSCDICSYALMSLSFAIPPWMGCVHVGLYISPPPSIHHCNVGPASLWHLTTPPYGETSIFKVSYFFCHNTYVKYYVQLFFHKVSEVGLRNKHPLKSSTH